MIETPLTWKGWETKAADQYSGLSLSEFVARARMIHLILTESLFHPLALSYLIVSSWLELWRVEWRPFRSTSPLKKKTAEGSP